MDNDRMQMRHTLLPLLLALLLALAACTPDGDGGLQGQLLFQDRPLGGVQVEVYLKADKDRSVQPFAVGSSDDQGRYRVSLPKGDYFVIGKKRDTTSDGRTRMLMAESPGNPHSVASGLTVVPSFNLREMGRQGGLVAEAGTGLAGQVTHAGEPVARAYVYLYTQSLSGLMGPSYGEAVQTGPDGRFRLELPAGRYYLVARKRAAGGRSGELSAGDLNSPYPGNPVELQRGEWRELGEFPLAEIDAERHAERRADGTFSATPTSVSGRIVDAHDQPVAGIHVFAYLDSRMVGKPVYISAPSAADGSFVLHLTDGGIYYIGARSAYGGPLEPGEWVGTYDGRPDHGFEVSADSRQSLGTVTVREVW
ncbi:MAG: carboxypeptidase-like regulatory domain-containing protein [Desulfuromonadales bacterium]|nr:carboxypeptidase-like regulatory domain-containing protein [Desulfuromonadales bacterium]